MGRHSAPEGRHRRTGTLLAQAGLVAVLGIVAVSVLFGSAIVRERMVNGTFTGSETVAEPSPGVETPGTSSAPSMTASASAAETEAAPGVAVTPGAAGPVSPLPSDSHEQVKPTEESRGGSRAPGTMTTTSADDSPDTTSPTSSVSPTGSTTPTETFANCGEAKAAGVSMIPTADPRYDPKLDHDGDGFACDAHGDPPTRHRPSTTPTITPTACPPPER